MTFMITPPVPALTANNAAMLVDYAATTGWANDLSPYRDVFLSNAGIAEAMDYANLPADLQASIWLAFDAAITAAGVADVSDPAEVADEATGTIDLTRVEALASYSAKVAHAFYVDIAGTYPWRLIDYTEAQLRGLFDVEELYFTWDIDGATPAQFSASVVDHSPNRSYTIASANLSGAFNVQNAVWAIVENVGGPMRHFTGGDDQWATTVDVTQVDKIARAGGHSASRFMLAMLRSVNIPGTNVTGYYAGSGGHASTLFEHANLVIGHGDDVYNNLQYRRATPSRNRLFSWVDWDTNILPLEWDGGDALNLEYQTLQGEWIQNLTWPDTTVNGYFTNGTNGWAGIMAIIISNEVTVGFTVEDAFSGHQSILDGLFTHLKEITGTDGTPLT